MGLGAERGAMTACCTVLDMGPGVVRVVLDTAVAAVLEGDLTVAARIQTGLVMTVAAILEGDLTVAAIPEKGLGVE